MPARTLNATRTSSAARVDPRRTDFAELSVRATLHEVLGKAVHCVHPSASVDEMTRSLADDSVDTFAVVDEHRFVGTVSRAVLVHARAKGAHVSDVTSPSMHTLSESTPIAHAIALMAFENIDTVPVVGPDGRFVGLVRARDLLRWTAERIGYVGPSR